MNIFSSSKEKLNIFIDSEREYWNNIILGKYFSLPTECTICNYSNIHIIENSTLNKPFLMKFLNVVKLCI
jgi:hypothetical protein